MTPGTSLLLVEGLGRDYAGLTALDNLEIEANAGEAIAFVGRNGSGKTTALSVIGGRLEPTRGTVQLAGVDIHRKDGPAALRALLSFVPDIPALYTDLTVVNHLELVGMAHQVPDLDRKIDGLLDRFDLGGRRELLPRELSRGMRQKLQLACGLLRPLSVLILDEPASGLDPPSRHTLRSLLNEAKTDGALVLLSTHQLDFAAGLIDRVVVLHEGVMTATGPFDEVLTGTAIKELGLE